MPYSPPGVQTTVVIDSTTVTLPGGTRILSLIGNADRTKSVQGEVQIQPTTRQVTVNHSGLNTLSRVYDFSGPGSSLYTYPTSGAGAYGSGYFVSGDTINWTVAARPYPASTTPQIGDTYYVDYSYSGVATQEAHVISAIVDSGTRTALDITDVTAVTTVSGTNGLYSPTDFSSTAGYYLSGNSLAWSLGTAFASFALAQANGAVPSGSTSFVTTYNYSGSIAGEDHVQTSAFNNALDIPNLITILNVSGTSGNVYYASGTTTTPDTSGFGTSGSGWSPSGNNIVWSAVNPAAYGYPSATVAPVSGTFYIDYTYNKGTADYNAKNFVALSNVINEYGAEADWTLVTTGPLAGTYTLARYNPLTLGAKMAFLNNASLLVLVQNEGTGLTAGDYLSSLSKLETRTVDVIVPLTVGSGNTSNSMAVDQRALSLYYTKLHCETMSNTVNKKERVSIGSLGNAEIGDVDTVDTYIYTASVALDSKRIAINAPGLATVQLQDPSGVFQEVVIDGSFLSAAIAGLAVSPLSDVATPLTNQQLTGFTGIDATTSGHPQSEYLVTEMNNLAAAGVMVVAAEGPRIFVRQQLTTDQSNVVNGEFSVVTLIDYVAQAVRFSCNSFIGKKLKPATTIPAVKGTILATLQALAQNDIISSIGGIQVQIDPTNPTQLLVQAAYVPIFPLNIIKVTFTIKTLG